MPGRPGVIFRVEIIREETLGPDGVSIDITAYINRVPDDNEADFGSLSQVPVSMWNTRMLYTGDFGALGGAIAAVEAVYPGIEHINCYEWGTDETALAMAPMVRSGAHWRSAEPPPGGSMAQLDWQIARKRAG